MIESILDSTKKELGMDPEYRYYDPDIVLHINSILAILTQAGVGPEDGFRITDEKTTWTEFIGEANYLNFVKSFVSLRVKLLFDPPSNSSLIKAIETQAEEFLWRINVAVDPGPKN